MIAFSDYKNLLGKEAEGMSDEEIRRLRDAQYQLATIAFESWKEKRLNGKVLSCSTNQMAIT